MLYNNRKTKRLRRTLALERFEQRELFAGDMADFHDALPEDNSDNTIAPITDNVTAPNLWNNSVNAMDVNDDSLVTPLDALILINAINDEGVRQLSHQLPDSAASEHRYLDVNDDGYLSAIDILRVVNCLNNLYDESIAPVNSLPASQSGPVEKQRPSDSSAFVVYPEDSDFLEPLSSVSDSDSIGDQDEDESNSAAALVVGASALTMRRADTLTSGQRTGTSNSTEAPARIREQLIESEHLTDEMLLQFLATSRG